MDFGSSSNPHRRTAARTVPLRRRGVIRHRHVPDVARAAEESQPASRDLVARGQEIFRRENCSSCHPAPTYTSGELTPVDGFDAPFDHPNSGDVRSRSVGTDPGLALKTRKATGFHKIPSLRGLWYRPRLLHDASISSLEELFDPARLPRLRAEGLDPRGMAKGAIPGFEFLTKLTTEDKTALIAFLRSL